jgi:hypothetical protein
MRLYVFSVNFPKSACGRLACERDVVFHFIDLIED